MKKIKPASLAELEALVTAMPERYRVMVLLAWWCGLRFGELAELRRSDVNTKRGILHVRRGLVDAGGETIVKAPAKSGGRPGRPGRPTCPSADAHRSHHPRQVGMASRPRAVVGRHA